MRATLHDQLMREAGFEAEPYVVQERRRARRRRRARLVGMLAFRLFYLAVAAAALIELVGVDYMPRPLAVTFAVLAAAGYNLELALWLMRRDSRLVRGLRQVPERLRSRRGRGPVHG